MEEKNWKKTLSLSRINRIWYDVRPYANDLIEKGSKKDKELAIEYRGQLGKIRKKTNTLMIIRGICYALLYVSLLSAFLGDIIIISEAVQFIALLSGVLGASILIALVAILTKFINIYVSDAHIRADFIIALYVKNRR